MIIVPRSAQEIRNNLVPLSTKLLKEMLSSMELDQIDLCIPVSTGHSGRLTHLHMHPMPEINIQISGVNNLKTPIDSYRLLPDSICIIPDWLPHEARPDMYKGEDFCHFVIQHSPSDISFHFSHMKGGETVIIAREHFDCESYQVSKLLSDAVSTSIENSSYRLKIIKGLMIVYFSLLLDLLKQVRPDKTSEHTKIAYCKELISGNLTDPALTVRKLSEWIKTAPDYLSQLFHSETGQTLKSYINTRRIALACHLLKDVSLNISEIAWICGYRAPGYFSRIFKKIQGRTPGEFRNTL